MFYDKVIHYLEYWENGEKIRSAGFVKIEIMDQVCNIQVNVTGLHPTENCTREVHMIGEKAVNDVDENSGVLGEIALRSGKGILIKKSLPLERLCHGLGYSELAAVRINLGKSRELFCRWKEERTGAPELPTATEVRKMPELEPVPIEPAPIEPVQEPMRRLMQEPMRGLMQEPMAPMPELSGELHVESVEPKHLVEFKPPELERGASKEADSKEADSKEADSKEADSKQAESRQAESKRRETDQSEQKSLSGPAIPPTLHEKKWRQLSEIYPHIAPFRDERDYLSIGPGDFVILPEKYYRLIANSFLLHGFYNYGHLVLARMLKKGEERFYVGVPGNFYEKERQAAIMFGFESFECKREPAEDGDYGYFMIRVEL